MSENTINNINHGKSGTPGPVKNSTKTIIIGRVLKVELQNPRRLGEIEYEPLFGTATGQSTARPLNNNIKQYPILDELVAIIVGPSYELNDSRTAQVRYYFPAFSLWLTNHQNKFPNLFLHERKVKQKSPTWNALLKGLPITKVGENPALEKGDIVEREDVRSLRPFAGDITMESRWGSSIRFGSTSPDSSDNVWSETGQAGDPIIILSNGHSPDQGVDTWDVKVEDINTDKSSIWITSTQEVPLQDILDNFSLESFKNQQNISETTLLDIPSLPASYDNVSRVTQDKANNAPLGGTSTPTEPTPAIPKEQKAVQKTDLTGLNTTGGWLNIATDILKKEEGIALKAYWDYNAYRVGYGSDTYVDSSGTVIKVTETTKITREDAERTLKYNIQKRFAPPIQKRLGEYWDKITDTQRAAIISYAYNVGNANKIIAAIKEGKSTKEVADVIRNGPKTAGGKVLQVLVRRREKEANLYSSLA